MGDCVDDRKEHHGPCYLFYIVSPSPHRMTIGTGEEGAYYENQHFYRMG